MNNREFLTHILGSMDQKMANKIVDEMARQIDDGERERKRQEEHEKRCAFERGARVTITLINGQKHEGILDEAVTAGVGVWKEKEQLSYFWPWQSISEVVRRVTDKP